MSSPMSSHGMALAAMATAVALSGTMILKAFGRQQQRQPAKQCNLRPCIASGMLLFLMSFIQEENGDDAAARKGEKRGKAKKRVRFGKNMVVEFKDDGDHEDDDVKEIVETMQNAWCCWGRGMVGEMPASRVALYSEML